MICISIQGKNLDEIFDILDRPEVEMAEIRLDRCPLFDEDIESLFSLTDVPLIATCRISSASSGPLVAAEAERRLAVAIEAGAHFVDLEIEAPPQLGKRLSRLCRDRGTTLIRSFHDFEGTPSREELLEMVDRCRRFGGEVIKIVTTARSEEDVQVVRSLYWEVEEGRLVAFCMGARGRQSRLQCLAWGAPYTYASLAAGEEAADGQIPFVEMADALYGDMPCPSPDPIRMPASKSFAQRAILAAALAEGVSTLGGYQPCADSEAAVSAARDLGAEVHRRGDTLTIRGIGPLSEPLDLESLAVGESGLLTRLLIPVLARICRGPVTVTGTGTLLNRPLSGANDIMAAFGVVLSNLGKQDRKDVYVPLRIDGHLMAGRADVSGKGGSQLISGLLMALPLSDRNSTLFVHDPKSIPYMFITLDVLRKFGIRIANEMEGDEEFLETRDWSLCTAIHFKVRGGQRYGAASFDLEGDWSGAAPFLVAGAVFGGVSLTGLDTSSLQADLTLMDILVEAGASVSQDEDGTVNVRKAPLRAFTVDLNNAPDLFPAVAVLAAFCPGSSRLGGVGRLAGKESNRAAALEEMLLQMGVPVSVEGDEMVIHGHALSWRLLNGTLLRGGSYTSRHDHRLVMALSVAALGTDAPVEIDDVDCVAKSFPEFPRLWRCFAQR
ncbi:MAG: 3-phosphoshikimate 1-carboxyvinyltransferase [Bacteroidales bacterium]|nr:3-phosphoshikimate 1-carboxyvinyltransferase [Bacteroidales bacterium]